MADGSFHDPVAYFAEGQGDPLQTMVQKHMHMHMHKD